MAARGAWSQKALDRRKWEQCQEQPTVTETPRHQGASVSARSQASGRAGRAQSALLRRGRGTRRWPLVNGETRRGERQVLLGSIRPFPWRKCSHRVTGGTTTGFQSSSELTNGLSCHEQIKSPAHVHGTRSVSKRAVLGARKAGIRACDLGLHRPIFRKKRRGKGTLLHGLHLRGSRSREFMSVQVH